MAPFQLHPVLARDGIPVCGLLACRVLLMNDSRYPWVILVPEYAGLRDLDELPGEMVPLVWQDLRRVSQALRHGFAPDKLNVAALGNVVPQLHIHVIARFHTDDAWPQPVWGRHPPLPYGEALLQQRLAQIKPLLT